MSSVVERVERALGERTIWQRRGLWVWNAGNDQKTTREWIAANARRLGFEVIYVKVHNGASIFRGPEGDNADPRFFATLRSAGLFVVGWGWLEGDGLDGSRHGGVEAEADRAAERCKTLGLAGYVADPEVFYEFSPRDSPHAGAGRDRFSYSIRFVRAFAAAVSRHKLPANFGRAVASYGRADLHDLDWHAWSRRGPDGITWRCNMQAYANESHALDVDLCARSYERYWDRALIHPTIGVYRGDLGRHSPAAYASELHRAGTRGFSLYSLDSCDQSELAAYGRIPV